MTREYDSKMARKNARFLNSDKKGLRESLKNPEVVIKSAGKKTSYLVEFSYDARDARMYGCDLDTLMPKIRDVRDMQHIGKALIKVEEDSDGLRISKFVGIDRDKLRAREESLLDYAESAVEIINIKRSTQKLLNTILESILQYNHIQRKKKKQGVKH